MFEVTFIKEIRTVEEKYIANLTKRQLCSLAAGAAAGLGLYIYVRPIVGQEICDWLIVFAGIMCGAVGWGRKNGHKIEEYLPIKWDFIRNDQKRLWRFQTKEEKLAQEAYKEKCRRLEQLREDRKIKWQN